MGGAGGQLQVKCLGLVLQDPVPAALPRVAAAWKVPACQPPAEPAQAPCVYSPLLVLRARPAPHYTPLHVCLPSPALKHRHPLRRRYNAIINQLTWMTHSHNVKRVAREHPIDLYLRPPNISTYKLMDFHLMDKIVREAHRCVCVWGGGGRWVGGCDVWVMGGLGGGAGGGWMG